MYGKQSSIPLVKVTKMIFDQDSFYAEPTEFKGAFLGFSATMCDANGNLAFYSNGCNIYNKMGDIMENGDTINGPANGYWDDYHNDGYKASYFGLPAPANDREYYLIHNKFYDSTSQILQGFYYLMYSKIDMSSGLGKVTAKNVTLMLDHRLEVAAAVRHGNGRDWWIIQPHDLKPYYYKFLLTPEGFQGPFEQYDPYKIIDSLGTNHKTVFSPDGSKMIHYHNRLGVWVYDFDRCTGNIGEAVHIPFPSPGFGGWNGLDCEVSANSRYLYITTTGFTRIIQYDLFASDIPASGDTIAVYDGFRDASGQPTTFGRMQRGPNNKIYIATTAGTLLHVINHPDLPGAACGFVQRSINLPTWNYASLPYYPNYRLYDLPDSPCDTLDINTAATTPKAPEFDLTIYPNPASELFTVYIPGWQGAGDLSVTDALGRLVFHSALHRDRTTVQCASWTPGVYGVQVWKDGKLVLGEQLVLR